MNYLLPEFEPSSSYAIEVTSIDVYVRLRNLDEELVGSEDYLGFSWWWSAGDGYKHVLCEATAWCRKRIHDVLVHNDLPLIEEERNEDQQALALEVYRQYL
tara:strand:+ start:3468 stop:3770 length:303 start_codon:yes stop_codon:yes gene_type:complete